MKKHSSLIHIVGLACACLIYSGCASQPAAQPSAATAPSPNSAHLLIYRVPTFGTGLGMGVSVDGKDVGLFTEGRNYDGYLPAGQHTITVRVEPNRGLTPPAQKTLNVEAGQTYSYTMAWAGDNLVFKKNQ